jgi:hypothetical protein
VVGLPLQLSHPTSSVPAPREGVAKKLRVGKDVGATAAAGSADPLPNADWDLVAYGPGGTPL